VRFIKKDRGWRWICDEDKLHERGELWHQLPEMSLVGYHQLSSKSKLKEIHNRQLRCNVFGCEVRMVLHAPAGRPLSKCMAPAVGKSLSKCMAPAVSRGERQSCQQR
jgi:hypothetical protein